MRQPRIPANSISAPAIQKNSDVFQISEVRRGGWGRRADQKLLARSENAKI